ncbi:MAG: HDOD domain-containing protein [Myxococcaceae bacterium]
MLAEAVRKDSIRVPPYPMTAMKLQQVLARPDYLQSELVNAMRTDAVFTGNLLRLANSPFYRRGEAVTSLQVAVGRIGAKELTRLAMAATVTQASTGAGPPAAPRPVATVVERGARHRGPLEGRRRRWRRGLRGGAAP